MANKLIDELFETTGKIVSSFRPSTKTVKQALDDIIDAKKLNVIKSKATIFDKILSKAQDVNIKRHSSIKWLQEYVQTIDVSAHQIINNPSKKLNDITGNMVVFRYDAKYKKELPYWDKYPIIFPFSTVKSGFMGINFHYLEPQKRAVLLDALYSLRSIESNNEIKLIISYAMLLSASKFRYFKPCIKRYLYSHVKSKIVCIEPKHWPIAIFLPIQQFQKVSNQTVYAESNKKIRKQ